MCKNVRVVQVGGGGRGVLHGERPGAEEPRAAQPEHGRDLGAEEVMEDGVGTSRNDRPNNRLGDRGPNSGPAAAG